jgi:hypothetical protein
MREGDAVKFEDKLRARRGGITSHIAGEVRISYEERDALADAIEALRYAQTLLASEGQKAVRIDTVLARLDAT